MLPRFDLLMDDPYPFRPFAERPPHLIQRLQTHIHIVLPVRLFCKHKSRVKAPVTDQRCVVCEEIRLEVSPNHPNDGFQEVFAFRGRDAF